MAPLAGADAVVKLRRRLTSKTTVSDAPQRRSLKRLSSEASDASESTRAPSSPSLGSASDSEPSLPPPKRRAAAAPAPRCGVERQLCEVVHQFGLVGGTDYDSKEVRLIQLLERVPHGAVLVFCNSGSLGAAKRAAAAYKKAAVDGHHIDVVFSAGKGVQGVHDDVRRFCLFVNWDLPASGEEYRLRVSLVHQALSGAGTVARVLYSMVEYPQLQGRSCREIKRLLGQARRAARGTPALGGAAKVAELDTSLATLGDGVAEECEDEEDGSDEGSGDACDCTHCTNQSCCALSFHAPLSRTCRPGVEVARVHLESLKDLPSVAPYMESRLPDHACTIVCLHNLNCHTPWDGYEHMFALPSGMGSVRVVMVLATDCSWHDYRDVGSFSGGVAWADILDAEDMEEADRLVSALVDIEVERLGGRSERLFLMGCSQGGGQSMLRFLRSQRRLGGWIGSVCHVPTAPHLPRHQDPLLLASEPLVNHDRPVRLLAGECDATFAPALVERDIQRLREVGKFTDVVLTMQKGLTHEGPDEGAPPDLVFLRQHLPTMLRRDANAAAEC